MRARRKWRKPIEHVRDPRFPVVRRRRRAPKHLAGARHAVPALDLRDCADAVIRHALGRAGQRGLAFEWLCREPAPIHGEAELLQLAISNLIENAIDFAPHGSTIALSIELKTEARVTKVSLSLRDRGPGVPDYAMDRLGQRFFSTARPAADGRAARRGSGLGLAIVREIMALHGGRLEIANVDPGLRVALVLNAAPAD